MRAPGARGRVREEGVVLLPRERRGRGRGGGEAGARRRLVRGFRPPRGRLVGDDARVGRSVPRMGGRAVVRALPRAHRHRPRPFDLGLELGGRLKPSQVRVLRERAPHRVAHGDAHSLALRRRLRLGEFSLVPAPSSGLDVAGWSGRVVVRVRARRLRRRRRRVRGRRDVPRARSLLAPVGGGRRRGDGHRRRARFHLAEPAEGGIVRLGELLPSPRPREALVQRRPSFHVVLSTHVAAERRAPAIWQIVPSQ